MTFFPVIFSLAVMCGNPVATRSQDLPPMLSTTRPFYCHLPNSPEEEADFVPPMSRLGAIFDGFEEQHDTFWDQSGAHANQPPLRGPVKFKVLDPEEFPMINGLRNDDPDSFWYSGRSNILGTSIPDEWDWSNLINTDRSDFTDTPFTVGTGVAYLESGYTYAKVREPGANYSLRTLPETLLRYGTSEDFELRLKWVGYTMIDARDPNSGMAATSFGTSDLDLGFKWQMFPQKGWFPKTTIVPGVLVPTGTNSFSGNSVQPHFNFVQGWGIRRYIYLKHQFGFDYLTQPNFQISPSVNAPFGQSGPYLQPTHPTVDSFHSSISCLYQLTQRVGGFVEWYVLYGNTHTVNYTDSGLFYYLTPNVQLDCTIGTTIDSPNGNVLFTKCGFSTRW